MAHADGGLRMAELGLGGQAQVPGRNLRVLAIQPWVFNPLKWEPAYCEARGARREAQPRSGTHRRRSGVPGFIL